MHGPINGPINGPMAVQRHPSPFGAIASAEGWSDEITGFHT